MRSMRVFLVLSLYVMRSQTELSDRKFGRLVKRVMWWRVHNAYMLKKSGQLATCFKRGTFRPDYIGAWSTESAGGSSEIYEYVNGHAAYMLVRPEDRSPPSNFWMGGGGFLKSYRYYQGGQGLIQGNNRCEARGIFGSTDLIRPTGDPARAYKN